MKEFFGCCVCSMLAGLVVGAVLVTKNKELQSYVKQGANMVEDKIEDIKQAMNKAKQK